MFSPPKRSPRRRPSEAPARTAVEIDRTPGKGDQDGVAQGQIFAERYRIEDLVARGGMGNVWSAYDTRLGRRVALKITELNDSDHANLRQRFLREAALSRQLRGRPFVEVFDHGIVDNRAFLVMELLEGETLLDRLRRAGTYTPIEALLLLRGIGAGLRVAHALQVVHRDLKPSNIFLARSKPKSSGVQALGERVETIKVLDFGIAKDTWDNARLTRPDVMLGSTFFMSPEQITSGRDVDPRSDLWAVGVIMYLVLVGRLPFRGSAGEALAAIMNDEPPLPSSVDPQLSARVDRFFSRALQKPPNLRFESIDELVDAFETAIAREPSLVEDIDYPDCRLTIPAVAPDYATLAAEPTLDPIPVTFSSIPPASAVHPPAPKEPVRTISRRERVYSMTFFILVMVAIAAVAAVLSGQTLAAYWH